MKYILNILLIALLLIVFESVTAQPSTDKVVTEDGVKYVLHEIKTGETIFSLTQKYKVDRTKLEQLNPGLEKGPSIGDQIKIPFNPSVNLSENVPQKRRAPDSFINYKINSRKETAYFIAKEHDITVEELYEYNPGIIRLKKGRTLRIPVWNKEQSESEIISAQSGETRTIRGVEVFEHKIVSGETLYAVSKRFKISEAELLHLNPDAVNLKAGQVIYIPVKNNNSSIFPASTTNSESRKYFEHVIESGETLWGTAYKYGVTEDELKELNPFLNAGFQAGAKIKIPIKEALNTSAAPGKANFRKHKVEKGETLYSISHEFDVSILDLKSVNPVLDHRGLVAGETIFIPEKRFTSGGSDMNDYAGDSKPGWNSAQNDMVIDQPLEIPEACQARLLGLQTQQTYKIALFLPLFLQTNSAINSKGQVDYSAESANENLQAATNPQDTVIEFERKDHFRDFYKNTENFLQFYEGVLLAVDDLQKKG